MQPKGCALLNFCEMWADRIEWSNMVWYKKWYDILWYLKLQIAKNVLWYQVTFVSGFCYNVSLYQVQGVAKPDWDLTESLKRSKLEAPHSSQTQDHSNNKTRSQATRTSSDFPRKRWTMVNLQKTHTDKKNTTLTRNLLHPRCISEQEQQMGMNVAGGLHVLIQALCCLVLGLCSSCERFRFPTSHLSVFHFCSRKRR